MADEAKTAVEAAAEATKVTIDQTAEATEKTAQKTTKAAVKAVKAQEQTSKQATGAAQKTARKATRTAAKAATAPAKKSARRGKAPRKTSRTARPAVAAAAQQRNTDVNFDATNWFAQFGAVPTAAPFQSLFAEAGERSQEAVRRSQKAAEQLVDLTRANVEAIVDAGRIAVEGARSIGQDVVASSRENVEQAADAVRALAEVKSPTEFLQVQSEFARASFDRLVTESSRFTESFVKLAGETVQPLSTRATLNAERLNQFVA